MNKVLVDGGSVALGTVDLAESERQEGDPMRTTGIVEQYRMYPKESRFGDAVDEPGADEPAPSRCQARFVVLGTEVEHTLPGNQMLVSELASGIVKVVMTELVPHINGIDLSANEKDVREVTSADFDRWLNHTAGLDGVKDTYDDGMPMLVHFYRAPCK